MHESRCVALSLQDISGCEGGAILEKFLHARCQQFFVIQGTVFSTLAPLTVSIFSFASEEEIRDESEKDAE